MKTNYIMNYIMNYTSLFLHNHHNQLFAAI